MNKYLPMRLARKEARWAHLWRVLNNVRQTNIRNGGGRSFNTNKKGGWSADLCHSSRCAMLRPEYRPALRFFGCYCRIFLIFWLRANQFRPQNCDCFVCGFWEGCCAWETRDLKVWVVQMAATLQSVSSLHQEVRVPRMTESVGYPNDRPTWVWVTQMVALQHLQQHGPRHSGSGPIPLPAVHTTTTTTAPVSKFLTLMIKWSSCWPGPRY